MVVQSMLNKLHGQPDSYDKKLVPPSSFSDSSIHRRLFYVHPSHIGLAHYSFLTDTYTYIKTASMLEAENKRRRSKYRMGKTLGAGTYGVVREADSPEGKVAVKIILKKNVKGNDKMVYDELDMLQRLHHPHIVKFVDWFESRVRKSKKVVIMED